MPNTSLTFTWLAQKAAKVTGLQPRLYRGMFHNVGVDAEQSILSLERCLVAHYQNPLQHRRDAHLFLIQNMQNRDTAALQLKLDELLRAMHGPHNASIKLEELTAEDLTGIKERYARLAEAARQSGPSSLFGAFFGQVRRLRTA